MIPEGSRFRWRLLAACVLLTGLAMTQSSGLLVPDTKLDLAIAPLDFLSRAAHLWDGDSAFGQLQNQAYGYLWPMGPFFALGGLLNLPGWVVQRLWMALVMCVAFTGAARVSRAMGVRSDLACILGGLAYALSPRMLTVLGPSSIEVWPMALVPWVLLPLVLGAERGSPRRAAGLSALAIGMVGGVNAAATSAVLPLGALWLLTRSRGPRRRSLMIWWPTFTLLATLWWLVPLFLLGAYSPPFLDFIESAAVTTVPTDLTDALRGTSNWVPFVDPTVRAGNDLIRQFYLPVNSAVVVMAGVLGMSLRRTPHRLFLASGLVVGLFLVSMGHTGAVQGWLAPGIMELLDGVLAPLRNVHKFDPVLRLPLAIGLAWLVDWLVEMARAAHTTRADRANYAFLAGVVAFSVLAAATPAAAGRITPAGGFQGVPDYWKQAAAWLEDESPDGGVALLAPGSMFGSYVWGAARDEPFQALAESPWAVRNAVPLAPAGNIRMLDAIESQLAQGRGSAGLTRFMARAGITHVVVRNDLTRSDDHPDPVLVHQALEQTPGVELVALFGPSVGGGAHIDGDLGRALVNGGWQNDYAAVEVFKVDAPSGRGTASSQSPVVVGGPEDLLDLLDLGVIDDAPVILAADARRETVGPVVLTDGYRAVRRHFGRIHDASSPVQTRDEMQRPGPPALDYQLPDSTRWATYADYAGIDGVSASSSIADAGSSPATRGGLPYAALDGDRATAWQSGRFTDDAHWWEVALRDREVPQSVTVTTGLAGEQTLVVSTDDWTSEEVTVAPGVPVTVSVNDEESATLRVTDASGRASTPLALAEVALEGIDPVRVLELPLVPEGSGAPEALVLRALSDARTGCAVVDLGVRCVQGRAVAPEERLTMARRVTLPESASYDASIQVRAVPGEELVALVQQGSLVAVEASTTGVPDLRGSALAAVDGDPLTTWYADASDVRPSLEIRWLEPQTIRGISVAVDADSPARAPQSGTIRWPGGQREVTFDSNGEAQFRPFTSDQVSFDIGEAEPATSVDFSGTTSSVPVGISELRLSGARGLPRALGDEEFDLPCGAGPTVVLNGERIQTSVTATPRDLFLGVPVRARLCGSDELVLRSGENMLIAEGSATFAPASLVLKHGESTSVPGDVVDGTSNGAGLETLLPAVDDRLVASHQNANPGWSAQQAGQDLVSVTVDGWRQAWQLQGEAGPVEMSFRPGLAYRWSLGLGAGLFVLLVGLVAASRRWRACSAPGISEATLRVASVALAVVVAGAALAGPVGLLVAIVAAGVTAIVRRSNDGAARALAPIAAGPAIIAFAALPWGGFNGWAGTLQWPSYLVVVAVAALLALVADEPSQRFLRPKAGSSTQR